MGRDIRILHVDDDPDQLELVATGLEREDERFAVETAASASEGLEALAAGGIDCVVSDFDMPGTDGLEFLEMVRERHGDLPFVLFTGKGSEEVASEAISAGVTDYLQKSGAVIQYSVLANRIHNAVERRRARRELAAAEEKLRQLAENTDDVLFMFDDDWSELLFVNSTYEEMWGAPVAEVEADPTSFLEYVHPEDREAVRRAMERLSAGEADEVEYRVVTDDGERRWVRAEGKPIFDDAGDVHRVVGFVRDVTERVERERELEQYETIVQTSPDPIFVVDREGRFVRVNDALTGRTGHAREDLLGEHFSAIVEEEEAWRVVELLDELLAGTREEATAEFSLSTDDGANRQCAISVSALGTGGEVEGAVVVAHDVTDLRTHQRRLSVLDRVLRHNLRNKMNVVAGQARQLREESDRDVAERAATIHETARDLLALSDSARRFETAIEEANRRTVTVDVADVARTVAADARRGHPEADVRTNLPASAPVLGHETLELAIDELVENAIAHSDRERPTVDVRVEVGEDAVEVTVADDGPGLDDIDRRALRRGVESPLVHTQGIGLWLVRWTVESLGGEVDFAEADPRGTVVTITLDRAGVD